MSRRHHQAKLPKDRIFIAIRFPRQWRRELRRFGRLCQRRYHLAGRWLPPASFHLTLLFLGWTLRRDRGRIEEGVRRALAGQAPFRLRTGGLGIFPGEENPQLLWLGIQEGADELTQLHQGLLAELRPLVRPEPNFVPHITLARWNRPPEGNLGQLLEKETGPQLELEVSRVALLQSFLHPQGAVYHQRRVFSLREKKELEK